MKKSKDDENLRDLFAGFAMLALVNRMVVIQDPPFERTAEVAYLFADHMLRARTGTDTAPQGIGGTDD